MYIVQEGVHTSVAVKLVYGDGTLWGYISSTYGDVPYVSGGDSWWTDAKASTGFGDGGLTVTITQTKPGDIVRTDLDPERANRMLDFITKSMGTNISNLKQRYPSGLGSIKQQAQGEFETYGLFNRNCNDYTRAAIDAARGFESLRPPMLFTADDLLWYWDQGEAATKRIQAGLPGLYQMHPLSLESTSSAQTETTQQTGVSCPFTVPDTPMDGGVVELPTVKWGERNGIIDASPASPSNASPTIHPL
jgi:hypothetical protein